MGIEYEKETPEATAKRKARESRVAPVRLSTLGFLAYRGTIFRRHRAHLVTTTQSTNLRGRMRIFLWMNLDSDGLSSWRTSWMSPGRPQKSRLVTSLLKPFVQGARPCHHFHTMRTHLVITCPCPTRNV